MLNFKMKKSWGSIQKLELVLELVCVVDLELRWVQMSKYPIKLTIGMHAHHLNFAFTLKLKLRFLGLNKVYILICFERKTGAYFNLAC